jgi:hypothetical protein
MVSASRGISLKRHNLQRAIFPVDSFWTVLAVVIDRVEIVVRLYHSRNRDGSVAEMNCLTELIIRRRDDEISNGVYPLQFRSGVLSLSAPELARSFQLCVLVSFIRFVNARRPCVSR